LIFSGNFRLQNYGHPVILRPKMTTETKLVGVNGSYFGKKLAHSLNLVLISRMNNMGSTYWQDGHDWLA